MKQDKMETEFYAHLKEQLKDTTSWPSVYLYKFIVPANQGKDEMIQNIFANTNAQLKERVSSKGTYVSVSIRVMMPSPDAVIEKYIEVSKVEGVISL